LSTFFVVPFDRETVRDVLRCQLVEDHRAE
jgi:hypothetical protein